MSEDDLELERLKAKRLAEMQKNISSKQKVNNTPKQPEPGENKPTENPREFIG